MAKKNSLTASYDSLPLIIRVLIQIFAGVVAGGVYRIVRYFETKNLVTLLVGALVTFTGVGNVISWIIDLYTLIRDKKYSLFVD
jgi:hypothetical protein